MNVSEVICRYLQAAGVDRLYGYPGDPSVEFLEAARQCGMGFVLGRREGTAGLMAQAHAMVTGRPGVCLSTLGPGSSNLVNAVASAYLDRVPMIAISGQIAAAREPLFTHQIIDQHRIFSPISKWATHVRPDNVGGIMRRALSMATAERPGPVHLTTHADVVGAKAEDAEVRLPPMGVRPVGAMIAATPGADAALRQRLDGCRKPVILAGIAAERAGAGAALMRAAEKLGAAVVVAPMAKGIFPEDHPLFAGVIDMACNDLLWSFLREADLLLNVGFDAVELIKPWKVNVPTVHIDMVPNTDQVYPADVEYVGDIGAILDALTDSFGGSPRWSEKALEEHRTALFALMNSGQVAGKLNPSQVVAAIRAGTPRDTLVTTDVGSHKLLVGQGWTTYSPRSVLMTNGLSSMGFSLPAGIAAKNLLGDRRVISFMGDGGLAMVQSELRLAAALKLGLTVVVFCDGSLNRIELKQMARQFPSIGTRIEDTDIVKMAESMDCDGLMVDRVAGVQDAIAQQSADRPLVIGARIDPAQYLAQF